MSVHLRKRKLDSGKVSLFLDITQKGTKRRREFLGLLLVGDRLQDSLTLRRAKIIRDERAVQLLDTRWGASTNPEKKSPAFVSYAEGLVKDRGKGTRDSMMSALRYFKACFSEDVTFAELGIAEMRKFCDYLTTYKGLSANSAHLYLSRIKTAFSRALADGIILRNPTIGLKIKITNDKLPTFLTLEEVQRLASTSIENREIRSAFIFDCLVGLRWSDTVQLKWSNIDDEGFLTLTTQKTQTAERIALSRSALKILDGIPKSSEFIFKLPGASSANQALKVWAKGAGISKRISWHTSRHTAATLMLSSGIDYYTVSKLLGHSSPKITARYARVVDENKRKAVDLIPDVEVI